MGRKGTSNSGEWVPTLDRRRRPRRGTEWEGSRVVHETQGGEERVASGKGNVLRRRDGVRASFRRRRFTGSCPEGFKITRKFWDPRML